MGTEDFSSDAGTRKILLIGDIGRAFLDAEAISELPCEVYANMLDAIDAATKNSFAAIAVVMSGMSAKLSSALRKLRQENCDAKIVLLAQMHEEPIAMQLVDSAETNANVADDYLICPIQTTRFYECIMGSHFAISRKTPPLPTQARRAPLEVRTEDAVVVPDDLLLTGRAVEPAAPATVDATAEAKIKQLEKLATEDDLTGLKNRRYIWEFSRQIIEHARVENGRVTLLVFDIDNFKHYNDVYGHSAGDEILKQAAVLMRRCCRGHDVVGRIGGDEFAVIFWDDPQLKPVGSESERRSTQADHPKEAIFIAKRFRREFNKAELHLLGPEGKGVLTISGGLASLPRDGSTIEELFGQADKALLEAKRSGKDRIYLVGKPNSDIADVQ